MPSAPDPSVQNREAGLLGEPAQTDTPAVSWPAARSINAEDAPDQAIAALVQVLRAAQQIVAFTGAGLSTASGVPDFRTPGSPWMVHKPIPFDDFLASAEARAEAWRRKFAMDDIYAGAQPSLGHRALARLAQTGKLKTVITQNIDGLHTSSGLSAAQVIELHGNGTYAHCLSCDAHVALADIRPVFEATGEAPVCQCGGFIKSATISFGQPVPTPALQRAVQAAKTCDLLLVLGSSLVVRPAAALPGLALNEGASVVILNRTATSQDLTATLVLRGEIDGILPAAVDIVLSD